MQLDPYQHESVHQIAVALKTHLRVIFRLDTGGGKTVCFSEIAHRAVLKGLIVIVLTDRIELFKQASKSISKRDISICSISADSKSFYLDAKLFVGMVETVKRRLEALAKKGFKPGLIIVDEAHRANFFKLLDHWSDVKTIGATATPIHKFLHKYYTHIVDVTNISELIEGGYLSPCRAFQMQDDFSDLETKGSGINEEFTDKSLMSHFNKSKLYDGVIEKYLSTIPEQKTLVFNINIEHAELTTRAFNAAGIKSYCITSETPDDERAWILKEFSAGTFPVLNNCGILTTGYDEPTIEAVILNRATKSLTLFLQMCGRGSRVIHGWIRGLKTANERVVAIQNSSKPFFTVIDFGANHDRHGLWNETRLWSLNPPKKKKKGSGVAPIRSCINCGAVLPAQQVKCGFCGNEIGAKEKELLKGELVEVSGVPTRLIGSTVGEINIEDLIELQNAKVHKATYIFRELRKRGEQAIKEFADKKGYKKAWVVYQISQMYEEAQNGGTKITYSKIKQTI